MSRKPIIIAALVAIVAAAAAGGYYLLNGAPQVASPAAQNAAPGPTASSGPLPQPVMLIINKAAIMQLSKAGQDIQRQAQGYAQQARGELQGQISALESEAATLKAQQASLAPQVREQRVAAFEARRTALQQTIAKRDAQIKAGLAGAQKKMENTLGPILKQIMVERKANMIVDRQAVIFATDPSFDISKEAIAKLDAALPAVKVELAPPQQDSGLALAQQPGQQ